MRLTILIKLLIRLFAFFFFFLFLVTIAFNAYLILSDIKEKSLIEAQSIFGGQFSVGSLYFIPWAGLYFEDVAITHPASSTLLQASSLRVGTLGILRFFKNQKNWSGALSIKKIRLNDHLIFKKMTAIVHKKNHLLSIDPLIANLKQGKIQGSLDINENDSGSWPYQGEFIFLDLPLKELLSETTSQRYVNDGFLRGKTAFQGIAGKSPFLKGEGSVELLKGELKTGNFFGALSHLLPMEELALLKLKEATTRATYSLDTLHLHSLRLISDHLSLNAHGDLSYAGGVDLEAQLVVGGNLATYIKGVFPNNAAFTMNASGYCEIPFRINGSVNNLQTNFLEKITTPLLPNKVNPLLEQLIHRVIK